MEIKWYVVGVFLLISAVLWWGHHKSEKEREENKQRILTSLDDKVANNPEVDIKNWEELRNQCVNGNLEKTIQIDQYIDRLIYLYKKYKSDEIVNDILDGVCRLGMDEHMVREIKGSPSKIDVEILKTKTKRIYIYGNKSSGDVLTFEDGVLTKNIDR